jgi:hypothetical protein
VVADFYEHFNELSDTTKDRELLTKCPIIGVSETILLFEFVYVECLESEYIG